jgi:DNA-binding IclR family transcriptional regulator
MTDLQPACPPDHIKFPSAIACADEDDAVLITMVRVLGLSRGYKYRKSPPYTPDQLASLLGRPRTTLYRHLNRLQDLHWLRVERQIS